MSVIDLANPTPPPLPDVDSKEPPKRTLFTRKRLLIGGAGIGFLALGVMLGAALADDTAAVEEQAATIAEQAATSAEQASKIGIIEGELSRMRSARDAYRIEAEEYKTREADIAAAEQAVAAREAAVTVVEETAKKNSFADGGYIVGVSIDPGVYRTVDAGGSCYWGIYTSGTNKDDIIANDYGTSGANEVTLTVGQDFESSKCGTWTRVG